MRRSQILLVSCMMFALPVAAQDDSIGRMQVSIWPEYDDPSVLAIYDGRFVDVSRFPIKTSFLLPRGVIVNDACSLSHEGQHFCQLYTVKRTADFDEVELFLPYPNFYLSFHFEAFDVEQEKRAFSYRIASNHSIASLEVDIQQPLRSSAFSLSPAGGVLKTINGENHYHYSDQDIEPGQERVFDIEYVKQDRQPSVDIKYSRMSGPKVFSSPYETQGNFRTLVYAFSMTGMGILALLGGMFLWRRRRVVA